MRSLLLALSLAAAFVVLVPPPASASPLPVGVCADPVQSSCPGAVCVIHPTLQFIPNPTCIESAVSCVTCADPDVQNLRDCASTRPCHFLFTTCTEGDDACGHNLVCIVTYGGKTVCAYDPCSEMACF